MALIYEPSGKAREYSPLALNVYTGGCDHGCKYCYCKTIQRGNWGANGRPRSLSGLGAEAEMASRQILLSFISDPYCTAEQTHRHTRRALGILRMASCSVAVLTKGGTRCLDDLGTFAAWPDGRIKVGATLTFMSDALSRQWEPGAALPADRIEALKNLCKAGVNTWASIEPVIDASESLAVIEASLPYVKQYKVGKLNHRPNDTDWRMFGTAAVEMIRQAGRRLYVKNDLRPYLPDGYLTADECDADSLCLNVRPERQYSLFT